jgi:hypothetical protein
MGVLSNREETKNDGRREINSVGRQTEITEIPEVALHRGRCKRSAGFMTAFY